MMSEEIWMNVNKYRVNDLRKKIYDVMNDNRVDSKVLNKWYKYNFQEKIDEMDQKLWNVWFEYLEKYKLELGGAFEVDDVIFDFVEFIDKNRVNGDWRLYLECSNLLIKYMEAKNKLIV